MICGNRLQKRKAHYSAISYLDNYITFRVKNAKAFQYFTDTVNFAVKMDYGKDAKKK